MHPRACVYEWVGPMRGKTHSFNICMCAMDARTRRQYIFCSPIVDNLRIPDNGQTSCTKQRFPTRSAPPNNGQVGGVENTGTIVAPCLATLCCVHSSDKHFLSARRMQRCMQLHVPFCNVVLCKAELAVSQAP